MSRPVAFKSVKGSSKFPDAFGRLYLETKLRENPSSLGFLSHHHQPLADSQHGESQDRHLLDHLRKLFVGRYARTTLGLITDGSFFPSRIPARRAALPQPDKTAKSRDTGREQFRSG